MENIIFIPILFLTFYAIIFELKDQSNAYSLGKHKQTDSINKSFRKLKKCISYDLKTVKWRRILVPSVFTCFLVFFIVHKKLPNAKEFLLYIGVVFISFYITYKNYSSKTTKEAILYSVENIKHIKSIIKKKKNIILNSD